MYDSLNILIKEHQPMVLAYLRSMVQDSHLAEDLTQETFLAAQKSLETFNPEENFGRWLRGIARNKALVHWRTAKRKPLVVDSRVVNGIDEVFCNLDHQEEDREWWQRRQDALRDCLAQLSEHLREAIEQTYFGEKTLEQAAHILGSSRAAIAQRLSRARNKIRTCVTLKLEHDSPHDET